MKTREQQERERLLALAALFLGDAKLDSWADLPTLQRRLMGTGEDLCVSEIAENLPPELANVDKHEVLRPTVRGLDMVSAGRSLLVPFPAAVRLAAQRYRQGSSTVTLSHFRRCLHLTRRQAHQLGQIIDAEGNIFAESVARGCTRGVRRRRRWEILGHVSLYAEVQSTKEYLAIGTAHPVITDGRTAASHKTVLPSSHRWDWLSAATSNAFANAAGTIGAALVIAYFAIGSPQWPLVPGGNGPSLSSCKDDARELARTRLRTPGRSTSLPAYVVLMQSNPCKSEWGRLSGVPSDSTAVAVIAVRASDGKRTRATARPAFQRTQPVIALTTSALLHTRGCMFVKGTLVWRGKTYSAVTSCR